MSGEGEPDEEIVEAIYDGVMDGRAIEHALSLAIKRLDASGGNIHVVDTETLETRYFKGVGDSYTDESIAEFLDHWQYANIYRDAMRRAYKEHGRSVFLSNEDIPDDFLERAAYFQEFFSRMGQRWMAGGLARSDEEVEVSVAFNRPKGTRPFRKKDARFIESLLPHIRRASKLALQLGFPRDGQPPTFMNGFAQSLTATFLLDSGSRIHWHNEAADQLLLAGEIARSDGDRLVMADPAQQDELQEFIKDAADKRLINAAPIVSHAQTDAGRFDIEVLPASVPNGALMGAASLALMMIRPRGLGEHVYERLRQDHGLTPAETELAVLVAEGLSIDEAAKRKEVSAHTIRAQMRSIFSKTDLSRQNALAALVWNYA